MNNGLVWLISVLCWLVAAALLTATGCVIIFVLALILSFGDGIPDGIWAWYIGWGVICTVFCGVVLLCMGGVTNFARKRLREDKAAAYEGAPEWDQPLFPPGG